MNLVTLFTTIASLFCISPTQTIGPQVMVAQFTLYVDANALADGELILSWEGVIDRRFYRNNCEAFHDLCTYRNEICDAEELMGVYEFYQSKQKKDTVNYNRL